MKNYLETIFLLVIISFVLVSCNSFKYKSREEFKNEKEEIRKEAITSILHKNDITVRDKYSLMYIDYLLTQSSRFSTIEKQYPTPDFNELVNKAIPILYYSYSPENYMLAPAKWKEECKKYLVDQAPYLFNYGESKFRESLGKEADNNTFYLFPYFSASDPEQKAKGDLENDNWSYAVNALVWVKYFNLGDFKKLSERQQGELLHAKYRVQVVANGKELTDNVENLIDRIRNNWSSRPESYLTRPPLNELSDNAPMDVVFEKILQVELGNRD